MSKRIWSGYFSPRFLSYPVAEILLLLLTDTSSPPMQCMAPHLPPIASVVGTTMPAPDPKLTSQVHKFFKITVVDAQSQLPIAGVQLRTVNKVIHTTDDNGVVAFYEPGAMGRDVWFTPSREGYSVPADFLGSAGYKLHAVEGASVTVNMNKTGTVPPIASQGNLQTRLAAQNVPGKQQCVTLRIVDKASKRGVPLVALNFPAGEHISDSQGIVAYCNPDHMGALSLTLSSHGYVSSNVTLQAVAGGTAQFELQRNNVAERLYRMTGQGVYRDSLLLGLTIPIKEGALNGQVLGQDSVISTVYKSKVFWTWGDTDNLSYPLGSFTTPAGTSDLPASGGLDPDAGVNFTYLGNPNGFVSGSVPGIAPTGNPTWVGAMVAVPDAAGNERLFASFAKPDSDFSALAKGLIKFDDASQTFKSVLSYPLGSDGVPGGGQAFKFANPTRQYAYFGSGLRIPSTAEAMVDPNQYEIFSPFLDGGAHQLDRSGNVLQYKWRKAATGLTLVDAAIQNAGLDSGQALNGHLHNIANGSGIGFASGSITWNEYRGRFVQIGQQKYGNPSVFGEIWYAEADTPMGPWVNARKVVSHNDYTFYNPYTHPYLSQDKGRTMYFEASYTAQFSGASRKTPRYDYNQIMYRISVDDLNLLLPVAIYDLGATLPGKFSSKPGIAPGSILYSAPFLAPDRQAAGTLAVGWNAPSCDPNRKMVTGASVAEPLFYAMPGGGNPQPSSTIPLYEYMHADGRRAYAVDASAMPASFVRAAQALAYVWTNPVTVKLPIGEFRGNLVVNAGADQCVTTGTGATSALVSLTASTTRKAASGAINYRWRLPAAAVPTPGAQCITSQTADMRLPKGLHAVVLEADDASGNISADTVLVQVK
ncbi:MAG: hypothetical protein V4805_18105 [Pseudomonadota bacterium]